MAFKKGDKVRLKKEHYPRGPPELEGTLYIGTYLGFGKVSFDNFHQGHNADDSIRDRSGWFINDEHLEYVNLKEDEDGNYW